MQTVRKRILEILKQRRQATVGELARQLGMAPVSVRYHLDILQGDNLIEVTQVRREGNVGRPQQVYGLTREADAYFPHNFAPLIVGLVRQMKQLLPPQQVKDAFCALAGEMAQPLLAETPQDEALDERMQRVAAFLNERGYFARWETEAVGGGLLHTHNCPYIGVALEHRELCCMDLALVQMLTGQLCERVDSIADEGCCCTYRVYAGGNVDELMGSEVELSV